MELSKIFITNYPRINQQATFVSLENENEILEINTGYDIYGAINKHEVTIKIARDLITAILTFDKVYIEGKHIIDILQVFGSDYLKELLRLHIICLIPDQELNPVLIKKNGKWEHGFFPYPQVSQIITDTNIKIEPPSEAIHQWSHIENDFIKRQFTGSEAQIILYLIDENGVDIGNTDIIKKRINEETNKDISNPLFLNDPNFYRIGESGKLEYNTLNRIRLQELNKTAVIASTLNINNIKTDGAIKELLTRKTSSVFAKEFYNGIDALLKIEQKKGFPDLGELFVKNIIDLDDILKLREDFQNKIFRYWIQSSKYNEELMQKEIMNSVQNIIGSKLLTPLRWIGTNLIGITGFLPSLLGSACDSFIVDKILKGWHPNFFLDDVLKKQIDTCIAKENQRILKEKVTNTFKDVGRNDPCPCGSGKKFKKCHGKIL